MKNHLIQFLLLLFLFFVSCKKDDTTQDKNTNGNENLPETEFNYTLAGTNQTAFYNNSSEINAPNYGEAFYGQNAHFPGLSPSYLDNGDGSITDMNTGLMWQADLPDAKYTYEGALAYAENASIAGYTDWRLPSIKELYSLMDFTGVTGMSAASSVPYIDTDHFEFRYGDEYNPAERYIDVQYASTSLYTGSVMGGQQAMFGLNLADGRIKGYPTNKDFEVKLVRGNTDYGKNSFVDNGDGTISDLATGRMWDQAGSDTGMTWELALAWVQQKNAENYLGYNDWKLPDAKELQSIIDYSRSPDHSDSPAIDPLFNVPKIEDEWGNPDYPFYWTSTTHYDGLMPGKAVYISFGRALGFFPDENSLQDVHGAGAQRSDPKTGNPEDYPSGFGPQGDVIRIYNYVRCVREIEHV